MKLADLLEAVAIGDGEGQQEAFPGSHVLLSHGGEFLLTSRVQDCAIEASNKVIVI